MSRKSSILKGISISLIYAVIYWTVIIMFDIALYEDISNKTQKTNQYITKPHTIK